MMTSGQRPLFILCLFVLLFCTSAYSMEAELPNRIDGVETLDAEGLIKLAQSFEDLVVVDSRLAEDRSLGFLDESINLADVDTNCASLRRINPFPGRSMAFYCNGAKCKRSLAAVKVALQCGYEQLYWFRGGFNEWRLKDYPYMLE